MSGENLRTVQELMGHRDIKMTVRYAHLSKEHVLSAVEKLDHYSDRKEPVGVTDTKTDTKVFSSQEQVPSFV